jgi:cell division protein FtsB
VENILLAVIALFQLGQWVQKILNSDVNLASKIDVLTKTVDELKRSIKNDFVFRDVYRSDQDNMDRRVTSLERKVWNGGWESRGHQ